VLEKTRGIILHTVKYGDNSLILTVYTEKFGRQSFIVNSARSSRSRNKAGFLQPLFIVDLEIYLKKHRDLQRIKEIKLSSPFLSIPFDVVKTTQAMLIAEVLYKVIVEEEHNPEMFRFLESSLVFFDLMETGKADFHIWFLAHLTEYLGILPDISGMSNSWLDMRNGLLVASEPPHPYYMNPEVSSFFTQILGLSIRELPQLKISRTIRTQLLSKILEYYYLHFGNLKSLKSSDILKGIFQ
jgi:DNA repair protein RecO (recombination protein O)